MTIIFLLIYIDDTFSVNAIRLTSIVIFLYLIKKDVIHKEFVIISTDSYPHFEEGEDVVF